MQNKEIMNNSNLQPLSPTLVIAQGVAQNLPEIIGAVKEIYTLHRKEGMFRSVLQARSEEMNINKDTFKVLVDGLTELSKAEGADEETKSMYREMIRSLFDIFVLNMKSSQNLADFLGNQ